MALWKVSTWNNRIQLANLWLKLQQQKTHYTLKPCTRWIPKNQKINKKWSKNVPCFHECVEFSMPQSRFYVSFLPCLLTFTGFLQPCNTFLNDKLNGFYKSTRHLFICNCVLTNFWKGMPQIGIIKWLQRCKNIAWYNKNEGTCTCLQVIPIILDVGKQVVAWA